MVRSSTGRFVDGQFVDDQFVDDQVSDGQLYDGEQHLVRPAPDGGSRFAVGALFLWLAITVALWALAFVELESPPQWLAVAREVCFGTLANGLPDSWGWITLIASPLGVLGFLLAVWGRDLIQGLKAMSRSTVGKAAIAVLAAVPLVGAVWVGQRVAAARAVTFALDQPELPVSLPPEYPRTDRVAPALGLTDQRGDRVEVGDLAGRPTVVTFAYAHCATICPSIVYTAKQAIEQVDTDAQLVVVSLDPWRDTPSSLPSLVESWRLAELPARVLSGEVESVLQVLDAWNMPIERDEATGEIVHPGLVYVLDSEARIAYTFNSPPPGWIAQAVEAVAS